MIFGIAGNLASGKDTVGEILEESFGYLHVSSSDYLRQYISQEQLGVPNRDLMTRVANDIRFKKGASFLIDQLLAENPATDKLAISGVYSLAEVERIRIAGGQIISVACTNPRLRYERLVNRGTARDILSYDEFIEAEAVENAGGFSQQNIAEISRTAEWQILNNGTKENLRELLEPIVGEALHVG